MDRRHVTSNRDSNSPTPRSLSSQPTQHQSPSQRRRDEGGPIGVQQDEPRIIVSTSSRRGKARERIQRRREDRSLPKPNWSWLVLSGAVVGVVAMISLIMLAIIHNINTGGDDKIVTVSDAQNTRVSVASVATPVIKIQPWNDQKRYTILIMGIDKRPGETGTGFRTDTLILISIDPKNKQVGMLSIPRDLFVPIPRHTDTLQRINTAYIMAELERPGSGPQLAAETVQYNLGMPIDNYVVVSFDAVIKLIDAIDGIDIDVPQAIDDPQYPDMNNGFDPLYIPAGHIHMDGTLALKYARTRHEGNDDYDRVGRQQQVLLAIRQKVLHMDLMQLAGKAPAVWNEVSRGILTGFTLDDALSLGWYLKDIKTEDIHRGTLEGKYLQATVVDGETAITINRATVADLMTQVFGTNYNNK